MPEKVLSGIAADDEHVGGGEFLRGDGKRGLREPQPPAGVREYIAPGMFLQHRAVVQVPDEEQHPGIARSIVHGPFP